MEGWLNARQFDRSFDVRCRYSDMPLHHRAAHLSMFVKIIGCAGGFYRHSATRTLESAGIAN